MLGYFQNKNYYKFLAALKIFFLIFIFSSSVAVKEYQISAATPPKLIINEIMYDLADSDDKHEWIEILNLSNESVDLTNWRFNDGTNHLLNPPPKNNGQGSMVMPAGGFAIFADDAASFLTDHPGFQGTVIDTVMSLNNTSDALKLIDKDGNEIDVLTYQKAWGGAGNGKSLEKIQPNGENTSSNWQESSVDGGTPGKENNVKENQETQTQIPSQNYQPQNNNTEQNSSSDSTASSTQESKKESQTLSPETNYSQNNNQTPLQNFSLNILLNEILPYPADGPEWVELYNQGEEENLSGWQIDDTQDGSQPIFIPSGTKIQNQSYLVFKLNKNIFNNDGDTVRLLWPNNQIIHQVRYQKAPKGQGLSRKSNGQWQFSKTLTPGAPNVFSFDSQPPSETRAPSKNEIAGREERLTASSQNENNIDGLKENEQAENQTSVNLSASIAEQSSPPASKKEGTNLFLMLIGIGILGGVSGFVLIKIRKHKS